jgi:hypothetical protein
MLTPPRCSGQQSAVPQIAPIDATLGAVTGLDLSRMDALSWKTAGRGLRDAGQPALYDYPHTFWSDQYEPTSSTSGSRSVGTSGRSEGGPRRKFLLRERRIVRAAVGLDRGGDPRIQKVAYVWTRRA